MNKFIFRNTCMFARGLALVSLLAPAGLQAFESIDAYTHHPLGVSNISWGAGGSHVGHTDLPAVMGGEKDFNCVADAANTSLATIGLSYDTPWWTYLPDIDEVYLSPAAVGDSAFCDFVYDGLDDHHLNLDATGLGGEDLTNGGIDNVLRFAVSANNTNGKLDNICIYTDASNYSCIASYSLPRTTDTGNPRRYLDIPFTSSGFVDTGIGADFTNVGAISYRMNASDTMRFYVDSLAVAGQLTSTVTPTVFTDENGDKDFDSGSSPDTILYTVEITNTDDVADFEVDNVTYTASVASNASLVEGSVNIDLVGGNVTSGNGGGDTSVAVDVGTIADGEIATVTYRVLIDALLDTTGLTYSHQGVISYDQGTSLDVGPEVIEINKFDITTTMTDAPSSTNGDADGDNLSGASERVTFTAVIDNTGPNSVDNIDFLLDTANISNASLYATSVDVTLAPGATVSSGNGGGDTDITVDVGTLAGGASVTIAFDLLIDDPFFHGEFNEISAHTESQGFNGVYSDMSNDSGTGEANDATAAYVDAFWENSSGNEAVSVDEDGDGQPDAWNDGSHGSAVCDETCQDNSGFTLDNNLGDTDNDGTLNVTDTDDDNDGVADGLDAFPFHVAVSVDFDNDNLPDQWNDGTGGTINCDATCQSNSGLTLDDDDDNDSVLDAAPDACLTADGDLSADLDGDGCDDADEDLDDDNDLVLDGSDSCVTADFNLSADFDGDGCDDADEDLDDDNDGYSDTVEGNEGSDPLDSGDKPVDFDGDFDPDSTDSDDDNDGMLDTFPDMCPTADGNLSVDADADGCDDADEDLDDDNDGVPDTSDSCVTTDGDLSADFDGDGCDDADEDLDDDNDGLSDSAPDACATADGNLSSDADNDGCDDADEDLDDDGDGVNDVDDAFSTNVAASLDADNDGLPDAWNVSCNGSCQANSGLILDPLPNDSDNDGVDNDTDVFPNDGSETADSDGDGVGDNADAFPLDLDETSDTDGDSVGDNADAFPSDASETVDSDGDGVGDNADAFPNDASETVDSDGDGIGDNSDAYPNDADNDGVDDDVDDFPNDASETVDSDGDGVGDNADDLPNDASETEDSDGDGVGNNADAFPQDETESIDSDNDGTGDNSDAFPNNVAASVDADDDGQPDEWNEVCDNACQAASGLSLATVKSSSSGGGGGSLSHFALFFMSLVWMRRKLVK